ncbi:LacI family DNA-binding transcriptional regulator [Paraglaciecola aquimarina]|uniref:LacI family DNA-binding transcriptional regulator n=1 Tax=Paraglaciecola aquimarina TaxID=1235557 RepID=A0ABU3SUS5_9ALTE|nr:LacI family DNA-binding transcriptional regulator [Paraglaciecola aquimarina]MDU0353747.1 LacI family DNA-binding transcriptional regulator [Paraglaciecola aquimarina]
MVTLKDVADLAGVSTSTVSRVVSGKNVVAQSVKDKVEKAIKKTGYIPNINARALANKNSSNIGLVTPDLSLAFFGTLAAGVIEAADDLGVIVDICNSKGTTSNHLKAVDTLRKRGFKNIILDELHCEESEIIALCKQIPGLVLINRFIPQIANRCVCIDNVTGGYIAATELLNYGHRKIAFVTSNSSISDPLDRIHGAKQAIGQEGINIDGCPIVAAPPTIDGGRQAVSELLAQAPEFTGILAYNDNMATGAMNELQDRGVKVPEDVSVVGFDDLAISTICRPALTTMHYPIREMAAYAVKLSLELTAKDAKQINKTHRFVPEIVTRKSVSKV